MEKEYKQALLKVKTTIESLQEMIKLQNETSEINQKRFEQAKVLYESGALSNTDFEMQKIYAAETQFDVLNARLEYVCYMIQFY